METRNTGATGILQQRRPERPGRGVTVAANVLAAAFRAVARARAAKPLHPAGVLLPGRLERHGLTPATGAAWLDEPGADDVVVRLSRSAGFPEGWPDVWGLALRVPAGRRSGPPAGTGGGADPGVADLLLATSFAGRAGRCLLALRRRPAPPFTTVLPYRVSGGRERGGRVQLAALPDGTGERGGAGRGLPSRREDLAALLAENPLRLTLAVASPTGSWRPFATLTVGGSPALGSGDGVPEGVGAPDLPDGGISFDPVLHPLPGLHLPHRLGHVRARAYVGARDGRRADPGDLQRRP